MQSQQLAMRRHSFLLAVFAGAVACAALADDKSQAPPFCDGDGQFTCNRKVEDDGDSTLLMQLGATVTVEDDRSEAPSFIQSAVRVSKESADSEEESADSEEQAKTFQGGSEQASLKAWMMDELDRRDAAGAKAALAQNERIDAAAANAALAQNERMEEALRERDEKITHLQLIILELIKGINPKLFDTLQDHGANGLEDPMPSWEEVQELLLQRDVTAMVSSDKDQVRSAQARLKDLVLRSLVQLKKTALDWGLSKAIKEIKSLGTKVANVPTDIATSLETAKNFATGKIATSLNSAKSYATGKMNHAINTAKNAATKLANDARAAAEAFATKVADDALAAAKKITDAVKTTFDGIIKGVMGWVTKIAKVMKELGKFVKDLYDVYLKPIINFVWGCASSSKTQHGFMFCLARPVIDKVLDVWLVPTSGSVKSQLPFPHDGEFESLVFDQQSGTIQKRMGCSDCQENDPRDYSPSSCAETPGTTFFGLIDVTGSTCNVPFMPVTGESPLEQIAKKNIACGKKALLWKAGGIIPNISEAVEKTMKFAQHCQDTIPELSGKIGALLRKQLSDKNVAGVYKSVIDAAQDAAELKTSAIKAMQELSNFEPSLAAARSLAALFVGLSTKAQACKISFVAAKQSLRLWGEGLRFPLEKTDADLAVQDLANHAEAIMDSGRQALDTALSQVNETHGARGMADSVVSAVTAALDSPEAPLDDVDDFLDNCASARSSYMKVYQEVVVAGVPVIRMSVHERDGLQAAYFNFSLTGVTVEHYNFSWASLEEHNGQELLIGGAFLRIRFKLSIRKNPSSFMGIPIPSDTLGKFKFIQLEAMGAIFSLRSLGIPVDIQLSSFSLPHLTLPLPLRTKVAARDRPPGFAEALKNAAAKKKENEEEADSITKETHAGPKEPAGAAVLDNALDNVLQVFSKLPEPLPSYPLGLM